MGISLSHHTVSNVPPGEATTNLAGRIERRLRAADGLVLPLEEELKLLAELQEFELGRFLLHNDGLNGYWTSYVFRNEPDDPAVTTLERWLLESSLLAGIRERFGRFKTLIAREITNDVVLASVPCGLMDDLLDMDYHATSGAQLIGVDIDTESVDLAAKKAAMLGLIDRCRFLVRDAWQLGLDAEIDLLVSNGLNVYEAERDRLVELYRNFCRALRPGGKLLVSFIPAPPPPPWADSSHAADWAKYGITEADLRRDLAIFGDILRPKYLHFTSEQELREQLAAAGLIVTEVSYNVGGALPIATAIRPR